MAIVKKKDLQGKQGGEMREGSVLFDNITSYKAPMSAFHDLRGGDVSQETRDNGLKGVRTAMRREALGRSPR